MTSTPLAQTRVEPSRALIRALQHQIEQLADSISGKNAHRTAAGWVYMTCVHAWAADHHLIDGRLHRDAQPARQQFLTQGGTNLAWLTYAVADTAVHPCAWTLLDPAYDNPVRHASPSDTAASRLLDWWAEDAPALAYPVDTGPGTITGWILGDLLQLVTDERRLAHALAQSPWWLADGILDRTLIPAARDFRDETLRLIDPTCGTGHFLIRAIDMLWELHTTGSLAPRQMRMDGVTSWTPIPPAEAARRILAGVDGIELDPITEAVCRLRVTVYLAHLLHEAGALPGPLRLDAIPHRLMPRISVGDSLLAGKVSRAEYARLRPAQARIVNLGTDAPADGEAPDGETAPIPVVLPQGTEREQLALFS
ncbi:hypothetical protein [Streptomyces sp. NPDC006784]|uniref:hypothetical protein n=1 Tax=Streptomyces sp. NPDC006784 TaxID=3364764 RepID=UPI0036C890C0